jgi:hypothetical protein
MSKQLRYAMESILKMPYFKNEHAKSGKYLSGHEEAVVDILIKFGFENHDATEHNKLTNKNMVKTWMKSGDSTDIDAALVNLPNGLFIKQPLGSQQFPDILLKDFDGRWVALECKSTKGNSSPMWNDNLPHPTAIYIYTSEKENSTTVFMGKDIITDDIINLCNALNEEINQIAQKYKVEFKNLDIYERGFYSTPRKQHFQGGGSNKTNYFTHHMRSLCEKNVLEFCDK